MSITTQLKEELQTSMVSIVLCCIWVLGMLFSITALHLQKKTIENVKNNTNST
jgi:hypothetical protein